jgi:hypothetical protein
MRSQDAEDTLSFSPSRLRGALVWLLGFQLLAFVVMVSSAIGCVVVLIIEPISLRMIGGLIFIALVAMVAVCYFFMAMSNWRLFFFSTIPSSSHYLVMPDRLVRYSRAGKVVEEIPFANIAAVRSLTRRNVENPEITAKVIGIDLNNLDDRKTILDRQFCLWSRTVHRHDVVLIADFFDAPLKVVYQKIKKRWQQWQTAHPAAAKEASSTRQPRQKVAWYQDTGTYAVGCVVLLGLFVLGGLTVVGGLYLLRLGKGAALAVDNGPGPQQAVKPAEHSGPKDLPGLAAHWPLNEAQGKLANDASGNGVPGHIQGGQWVQGVQGPALRLDGKGDFVDLGAEPRLNFPKGGTFTVGGWIATQSNGVICSFRKRGTLFPIIELSVRQGNLFGWVRDDTSGKGGAKVTGGSVHDGQRHHVALVRQADGTIELFLDGVSQGRAKGENSGGPITTDLRALGCDLLLKTRDQPPGYLGGDFDDFRVYNRALAQTEIAALAGRK